MADQQQQFSSSADLRKETRLASLEQYRVHSKEIKGPLGTCLGRTFEFISAVVSEGLGESVVYSIETLAADRDVAFKHDKEKADPIRNTVYNLTHALGMLVESMAEQRVAERLAAATTDDRNYSPQDSFSQDSEATVAYVKQEPMDNHVWVPPAPAAAVIVTQQQQPSSSSDQQDIKPQVQQLQQQLQQTTQQQRPIVQQQPLPVSLPQKQARQTPSTSQQPQPASQPQKRAASDDGQSTLNDQAAQLASLKRSRTESETVSTSRMDIAAAIPAAAAEERHQCSSCPRIFPTSAGLIRHTLHHTSTRCPTCQQFVLKENMTDHMAAHIVEREDAAESIKRTTRSSHEEEMRSKKAARRRSGTEEEKRSSRSAVSGDYADLDQLDVEMEKESKKQEEKRRSSRTDKKKSRKSEKSIWDMDDDSDDDDVEKDDEKETRGSRRSRRDVSTTSSVMTAIATEKDGLKCPSCSKTIAKGHMDKHMEEAHGRESRRVYSMSDEDSSAASSSASNNSDDEYVDESVKNKRMERKRARTILKFEKKKERKDKDEKKRKEDVPETTIRSDDLFACNKCTRFFTSQAGLNAHVQIHFGMKCEICKKRFAVEKIMDHIDTVHAIKPTGKKEEKRGSSVVSVTSNASSNAKYKTPLSTPTPASAVSTEKPSTSTTAVKTEATPAAGAAAAAAPDVKDEKPVVFGPGGFQRPAEGPVKCKECSRVFDTQRGLNNHAHTHWGVGCPVCKARIHALKLADHYKSTHADKTAPTPIKCTREKCDAYRLDENEMAKHVRDAHAPKEE